MRSSTKLDSAVFQLTPTRTRCDLVISANGKTEKIASGLVNPFLAHLKTAQDQMAKGGYSVILEPEPGTEACWFTRGTIERFVRFVSTPEVLERVYTLESEILQIEETIAIQSNNDLGLNSVEDHQLKPRDCNEGSKPPVDSHEEKAIVLYQPGVHSPAANGSTGGGGNSKDQFMKVLETRKTALQKEQGMAFARAVAAGFDMDHMASLMSFAENFGALRLKDACVRFIDLWKRKHNTGQWVEIEASEVMANRSAMSASGIVLDSPISKQWPETPENNGKTATELRADEKTSMDQQTPSGHPEHYQFPHPMLPPWPIHSLPGALPMFQGYPMQGYPCYQNYPGNGPFFQPQYPLEEDPRMNGGQRARRRRHSLDSQVSYNEEETWEPDNSKRRSRDDTELGHDTSEIHEQGRKGSRSEKNKSGMVVIRNINYITSKREDSSGSETELASGSEAAEEPRNSGKPANSLRPSKGKQSNMDPISKEDSTNGKDAGGTQWQAFQNLLLKDVDEAECADKNLFAVENESRVRTQERIMGDDPLAFDGRGVGDNRERSSEDMQKLSGRMSHRIRSSNDASLISKRVDQSADGGLIDDMDLQASEINGVKGQYRRNADDLMIHGRRSQSGYTTSPSDPLAIYKFERDINRISSHNMDDDSYIVSLRSSSLPHFGIEERNTIDMHSELPPSVNRAEDFSNGVGSQFNYEPNELSSMPEHGRQKQTLGYDPALDYEMQTGAAFNKNKVVANKKTDKNKKSKLTSDGSDKKKNVGPIRKGKPSKSSPLDEARARAERLRTYKADLQKMKKETEEEQIKRLEALKLERQKRIAARSGSIPSQSASQPNRKSLPVKLSPSSHKGSKFSDMEPGSASPLQRSSVRTIPSGSSVSVKSSAKLTTRTRLSRPAASLHEPKKENNEVTPDTKASMARLRRLSEPKIRGSPLVSSVRTRQTEMVSKTKVSNLPHSNNISAILNHDKKKSASLPELKITTPKGSVTIDGKSLAKEMPVKAKNNCTPTFGGPVRVSDHGNGDENLIIEKTVVVLESEKPSTCAGRRSEEKGWHSNNHETGNVDRMVVNHVANHVPVPPSIDGFDRKLEENRVQEQPTTYEVPTNISNKTQEEMPNLPSAGKPYQAPYAQVSSLEDSCTKNCEHRKAPPMSLQTVAIGSDAVKAHVHGYQSLKLEKVPGSLERLKESSKGIKRLLKFGKKSHASSERSLDSDNVSINGSEPDDLAANTSGAHTLKNLISQDEMPTAGSSPQKSSRHFSVFSPFRSKSSDKKQSA